MMTDTYGPTFAQPLMRLDQDTQSWRTSAATSLWDLPMSSVTLPASGSMRSGELFERPMLEHLTDANDFSLLPTPIARDHKEQTLGWTWERNGALQWDTLPRAITSVMQTEWGKYEPAIRRWESLTRPVPEPIIPHKDKRRLNPVFVEWLMGLPEGHVTGHGLSAAKELKMLGNGVVPQQARAAISALMERTCQ